MPPPLFLQYAPRSSFAASNRPFKALVVLGFDAAHLQFGIGEEGPGLEPMFTLQCQKIMNIQPGTPHHPLMNPKGYHAMDNIITLHCAVWVSSKKSQTGLDCSLAFSRALVFFSLGWLGWGPSGSPKPASVSATLAARAAALSRARCAASDSGMCQKPAFYHRSIPDGYIAVTGQ